MEQSPYILIIDDDADDRKMLTDQLRHHHTDITIQSADCGDRALTYLEDCDLDELPMLIVVDYEMPGLYGPAFLQAIRHNPRYDKIIKVVWSTSAAKECAEKSMESGADKYFIKPCGLVGLEEIIGYINQILHAWGQDVC